MSADLVLAHEAPKTVLVVADDPFLRKLARRQLESLGCVAHEVVSVSRALARIAERTPDLILLDLWVDHGEGLALLERLRAHAATRKTPVLLVGMEPRLEVRTRAFALGASGPAPVYESGVFGSCVDAALDRCRLT